MTWNTDMEAAPRATCVKKRRNRRNFVGLRFGRLLVHSDSDVRKGRKRCVLCKCDCGNESVVSTDQLTRGYTKSCGCLQHEVSKNFGNRVSTHGKSKTVEYECWINIKKRCLNKNDVGYPLYGGRGIVVADVWVNDFPRFLSDMGEKPSKAHSIDRIDNDGDYSPENCRWASHGEQARNKSTTRLVNYMGKTLCVKDAAKLAGINYRTAIYRLNSMGLNDNPDFEEILPTSAHSDRPKQDWDA